MYKEAIQKLNDQLNWDWLNELTQFVIDKGITIQQIPAPTFHETLRANYVMAQFKELGLQDVRIDERFTVYGRWKTSNPAPALMVSAHTDTVFPQETDLSIKKDDQYIYGPGLGDNSIAVASMLGMIYALKHNHITATCDIWFVATSREEGLGDLGGIRMAYENLKPKIKAIINLEGLALGYIYHAGIAVKRFRITAKSEGGHSWTHFGRPSAIHALIELGARITAINVPQSPKTTFNIGLIEGGHSINSIATEASMWLDMRSEEQDALQSLESAVSNHIAALANEKVHFQTEVVGNRPAGTIDTKHPLIQYSIATLDFLNQPALLHAGSTDGNIPLADGFPAVTIGITNGGNSHRLDEYIEIEPISTGLKQLLLLTLAASTI